MRLIAVTAASLLALAQPAAAQLITIRTLPIAQADQFAFFPSQNSGMGAVSIALRDTLADPFSNPAAGSRLGSGGRLYSSPMVYSVSSQAGAGRTIPLGASLRSGRWFGSMMVALQEIDPSRNPDTFFPEPFFGPLDDPAPGGFTNSTQLDLTPDTRSHGNSFVFGSLGRTLREGLSLGGSLTYARITAIDGVDLMYAGSQRVAQSGHALDLRLGVLKEYAATGRTLEVVALHNRYGMAHDVTYLDFFWDPDQQQAVQTGRLEHNADRTNTWGLHVAYTRPLVNGWRLGLAATGNLLSHPKIPNYAIETVQSIPRDPGHSQALNLGVGLSRVNGPASFGVDVVFEPIRSHTWADSPVDITNVNGDVIRAGAPTIENWFRFTNMTMRMGVGRDVDLGLLQRAVGFQLGMIIHSVSYNLRQTDHVSTLARFQPEHWVEWTPTWGLSLRFPELELRYRGRVTHGTGRPGVQQFFGGPITTNDGPVGRGILAAPSGPISLAEVSVVTHQISVSVPLR